MRLDELDPETIKALREDIARWDSGSEIRRLFEESRERREAEIRPLLDEIAAGERLTAEDWAIYINI